MKYTVGDLLYFIRESEFAIVYETGIMGISYEPMIKIYWQREQTITTYYISTLESMLNQRFVYYPNES